MTAETGRGDFRSREGTSVILAASILSAGLVLFAGIRAVSRLSYDDCVVTETAGPDGSRTRSETCS